MKLLKTTIELREWTRAERLAGRSVHLVPTMGALHAGHLSLVKAASETGTSIVVSIFVNPTQFGPKEDFGQYPRTFEPDCTLLEEAGVAAIFAPSVEEMYPVGATTYVDVGALSERLDGTARPGHFRGVATIVTKLLIAAEPARAYFGQKDAAQVAVLRKLVRELGFGTELVVCPIMREEDGLAMSSRNAYLSTEERKQALVLNAALREVGELFAKGERSAIVLESAARSRMAAVVQVEYAEALDWTTLLPVEQVESGTLFAVAAAVGKTRLIDNVIL